MTAPSLVRSAAKFAFQHAGGLALARRLHRQDLRILMFHRFSAADALARQCAHIRRYYRPVSMAMVAEWLHEGRSLPPYALAVTVDDGYQDFQEAGYPVFSQYDIPVTVFLVTDFLDGKSWLWFDRVVYAFRHAKVSTTSIETPGGQLRFELGSDAARRAAGQHLADLAVGWSAPERLKMVGDLSYLLQVEMPETAPPESRPLTWDAVRLLAASGVEFGAHTRTHPILSAISDPRELCDEIAGSKARIEAELNRPVLHFCYPNGKLKDIGPAAVETVRSAGLRTAVTAEFGLNPVTRNSLLLNRIGTDPGHDEMYFQRGVAGLRHEH